MALAENSGLNPIETLANVKSQQIAQGNSVLGIDCMQTGTNGKSVSSNQSRSCLWTLRQATLWDYSQASEKGTVSYLYTKDFFKHTGRRMLLDVHSSLKDVHSWVFMARARTRTRARRDV